MINFKKPDDLTILNILHIFNDGFIVSLPLLLPFIKNELNFNLTQVGLLGSVLNLLGVFLAIPAGIIASKYGGLKSLTWAVVFYSAGFAITSISPNFWFIALAFIIAGSGFGLFHPIAFATVANLSSKTNRGKAMGNFTAIGDLGRVGISSGITIFATYLGWRLTSGIY